MSESNSPAVLALFPDALHAAMVVDALSEEGIRATADGDFTSSFQAEAPGDVRVLVRSADLNAAQRVLDECQVPEQPVDWSLIDCGDASPVSREETEVESVKAVRFSLAGILGLQAVMAILAAMTAIFVGAGAFDLVFGLAFVVIAVVITIGIVTVTVRLAGDFNRLGDAWRFLLVSCGTGAGLFLLIRLSEFIYRQLAW